jgi:RNA-binding protein
MTSTALSNLDKKRFRRIGHQLNPVVMVAGKGLNAGVMAEVKRGLDDHELLKIKVLANDKKAKKNICETICQSCDAEIIQIIGHTVLLYKKALRPNPKLSNLLR